MPAAAPPAGMSSPGSSSGTAPSCRAFFRGSKQSKHPRPLLLRLRPSSTSRLTARPRRIDAELVVMVVPSSGLLSRPVGGADGARQVELLEEAEMRQRIVRDPIMG